jgi:hypothetical protein
MSAMRFLPAATNAEYRGDYRIHLVFNDRLGGTVDLDPWLVGTVLEPLKDITTLQRFFVDGGTVVGPTGTDVAPEALYERVKSMAAA